MERRTIIVAATGASGFPLLLECLRILREDGQYRVGLIMSDGARLTLNTECDVSDKDVESMADFVYSNADIGACPSSGSFLTEGMLIVPCSMKTVAGICSGYADNLIIRAADVTIKEQRPLVLAARESPLSAIHLRNLHELSLIPGVRIVPPMLSFYHHPQDIQDIVHHIAARLVEPFGVKVKEYKRWQGI